MFSALCETEIVIPIDSKRVVRGEDFVSEPLIVQPRVSIISARPLMLIPPMPTKCICLFSDAKFKLIMVLSFQIIYRIIKRDKSILLIIILYK